MGHLIYLPNAVSIHSWTARAFQCFLTRGLHPAFQLPFGKTFRFFSLKWTFLAALLIFEVGSVLCAAAQSSALLIVGVRTCISESPKGEYLLTQP